MAPPRTSRISLAPPVDGGDTLRCGDVLGLDADLVCARAHARHRPPPHPDAVSGGRGQRGEVDVSCAVLFLLTTALLASSEPPPITSEDARVLGELLTAELAKDARVDVISTEEVHRAI